MNEENTRVLRQTYPDIFHKNFSFSCGDGWFELVFDLCEDLIDLGGTPVKAVQVKEKFGGLRFYVEIKETSIRTATHKLIDWWARESFLICETCGEDGELRTEGVGWLRTLCLEHYAGALLKRVQDYIGITNRLDEENEVLRDELRELQGIRDENKI